MNHTGERIVTTYLRLEFLNDNYCVFVGDSEETVEGTDMFGNEREHTNKFPAFQLSRKMWEDYSRPTFIEVSVRDMTHVVVDD